jgi:trk system potassium uptake protein TrkH
LLRVDNAHVNTRAVRFLLGALCVLMAGLLLIPAAVAVGYSEAETAKGFALSAAAAALIGTALALSNRRSLRTPDGRSAVFRREAIAVVGIGWIAASAIGAIPFMACGATSSTIDALFESISGFTTTGSTIFSGEEIDGLSHGVNFWRCFSQWIGGIGIVVVFVTILPRGGRDLFRSEGADRRVDEARVRDSAHSLVRAYLVLTLAGIALLLVAGLGPFDAVAHAFTCISTGGFSTRGASVGYFDSTRVEAACIVVMIAGGANFVLWIALLRRGLREAIPTARSSSELRLYFALLCLQAAFVALVLWFWGGANEAVESSLPDYTRFLHCVRDAAFSVVTLQTTTGLVTADFNLWPNSCRMLLMAAALTGACSGSTGGGAKLWRILVAWRASIAAVRRYSRPRVVVLVQMDGEFLDEAHVSSATRFFMLWVFTGAAGAIALSMLGLGTTEAITGVIACLNTTGPGLGGLGPSQNFGNLGDASKLVLSGLMLLGRLEFYALFSLLLHGFWRS